MKPDTKLDTLRRLPLFAGASARELRAVSKVVDEIDVPAGYTLTRQGELGHELVFIVDGSAEVSRDGRRINRVRDGDIVGEIAVLTRGERTATVTTTTPTRALVVTARDFWTLLERVPSLRFKVLEKFAAHVAAA
ncbi:MAG TPA: cyclic nucleotide-binding domain-containing protein [Gaiellaceae bacterium]|jgi:CRP-like cAMP-binding protein